MIEWNAHRRYGPVRLPHLLANWEQVATGPNVNHVDPLYWQPLFALRRLPELSLDGHRQGKATQLRDVARAVTNYATRRQQVLETYGPQTWEERSESTTWPTPVNNASVVGTAGRAARRGSTGNIFALQVVYCRKHGKPVVVPQSVWAEGGAPTTIGELRSRLWAKRGTFGFPPTKLIALHADMHSTSRLHDDVPIGSTIVQQHDGAKVVFVLER